MKFKTLQKTCAAGVLVFSCTMMACTQAYDFAPPGAGARTVASSWQTPDVVDLGSIDSTLVLDLTTVNGTYSDFRIASNGTVGAMVGGFYDGSRFRGMGRLYRPYSGGGDGWTPIGSDFTLLDLGTSQIANVAASFNSAGSLLAAFGDGLSATQNQSAVFGATSGWGNFASSISTVAIKGSHPSNGYSTSVAWDPITGYGYFAYVDTSNNAYVKRSTAPGTWDAGTGTLIGRSIAQVEAIEDGVGAAVVFRSNAPSVSFSGGNHHMCALSLNGSEVRCWGRNHRGQLGDGAGVPGVETSVAVKVVGLESDAVVQIAAGGDHTCALNSAGTVKCWGSDEYGQLGQGGTVPGIHSSVPLAVTSLTGVAHISAGGYHTCAVLTAGTVQCWGRNVEGQLGNSANISLATPQTVTGLAGISKVTTGSLHSCALVSATGEVRCWGSHASGQLGNNAAIGGSSNVAVNITAFASATALASGDQHTCALLNSATVFCWGSNSAGQLGRGGVGVDSPDPLNVPALTNVSELTAGGDHTCVRTTFGTVACWGYNSTGAVGNSATLPDIDQSSPTNVTGLLGFQILAIGSGGPSAGGGHNCAISTTGVVKCWGQNQYGQLATGVSLPGANTATPSTANSGVSCPDGKCLYAAWSEDSSFGQLQTLANTKGVQSFSTASDAEGNVVVVFLQERNPAPSCSSTTNCVTRVYASTRASSGVWAGPVQIDTSLTADVTSYYQNSAVSFGLDYPTPQVVYLGSGRFLAAWTVVDNSVLTARLSHVMVRGYTVGAGWDTETTTLESVTLVGAEQYRVANNLKLVSDRQGSALLMLDYIASDVNTVAVASRKYSVKAYRYNSVGGWETTPATVTGTTLPGCPVTNALCSALRPDGAIFPTGEAVVVFPAPKDATATVKLKLYSMEYF